MLPFKEGKKASHNFIAINYTQVREVLFAGVDAGVELPLDESWFFGELNAEDAFMVVGDVVRR